MVRDWVLLSLSNFTQRTPVAMAMWSLSCFFVSASTSQWISALYPFGLLTFRSHRCYFFRQKNVTASRGEVGRTNGKAECCRRTSPRDVEMWHPNVKPLVLNSPVLQPGCRMWSAAWAPATSWTSTSSVWWRWTSTGTRSTRSWTAGPSSRSSRPWPRRAVLISSC